MSANLSIDSDAKLIQQSRDGDESAYGQIVERYQSLVCSVAYSRCGDLAMSEDLAQEAFLQGWEKLANLSDVTKFKAWICTIVRNMANRSCEKATRNIATGAARLDSVAEPSSSATDPSAHIISAEQEQMVWQALSEIPENYREPMILFYREEQSVARVAEALEISSDAVKQRLSRGRKFLQQQLAATVEMTLENSKPSKDFTSAVLLGLSGMKAKSATVGAAAGAAAKAAAGSGLAWYLLPLLHLPFLAWLFKISWEDIRSPTERKIWISFTVFWTLAFIPVAALMWASIYGPFKIKSPFFFPALQFLYMIPMIVSARRAGKRIEELRIKEKTATPYRTMVANPESRASTTRLFVGSGLLVVLWPIIKPILVADWISVGLLLSSAVLIGLVGARFCGTQPKTSFRVYALSLGAIALVGIGVMYYRRVTWLGDSRNTLLWVGTMQAMAITQIFLSTLKWKRVYGKPK